jgi:glycosyl transferase, family 25
MRVFVVNLEQSTDRKLFMKKQLDLLKIPHEFFPAVDGRKLSEREMEEMCNMEVVREWSNLLTPGMIGCSLSHYHVYKTMVAENIELAFILEDDTYLSSRVPNVLNEIEHKIAAGTLSKEEPILLYYQSKEIVNFTPTGKVSLKDGTGIYYPIDIWRPITTAAYVISLSCAKRLVDLIYPIRYSPDSWAVYHRENAIAGLRCVLPLPVESGFFKSDIGYEQNKWLNRMVKKLEENNVFPVKQLLKWRRRTRAKQQNQFLLTQEPLNWQHKELL